MAESKIKKNYHWGTGRRKTSVARVRLIDGTGKITVNDRPLDQYFSEESHRKLAQAPLELVEMRTRLDMFVNVRGGGFTGQAGAICQGAARALKSMFAAAPPAAAPVTAPAPTLPSAAVPAGAVVPPEPPAVNPIIKKLRDSGYLTRDGRMKERKKYGRKGARKAFQFSKR